MSLVLNIFNEKTVAALISDGHTDTAKFVANILKFWKIVNVKNPNTYIALNDPDRKPLTHVNDERFDFLLNLADCIQEMSGNVGGIRYKSLTSVTRDSFVQTVRGLVSLSKKFLNDQACEYLLLVFFSN